MVEAGFPDVLLTVWYGIAAPAKTPTAVVDKLHDLIFQAMSDKQLKEKLEENGFNVTISSKEAFAKHIVSETDRLGKIIRAAGIPAQD